MVVRTIDGRVLLLKHYNRIAIEETRDKTARKHTHADIALMWGSVCILLVVLAAGWMSCSCSVGVVDI